MKILSAKQLQQADKATLKNQDITSEELMERAARLVFEEIHHRLQQADVLIKIFCGIGNNGGDGLVVARMLMEQNYKVQVFITNYSKHHSEDFSKNYEKLKNISNNQLVQINGEDDFPELSENDFIVDAIFGIGLNRPLEGWLAKLVQHINEARAFVLAIDMPSGLFSDKVSKKSEVIKANFTISFQAPKLVFFLPETMDFVGDMLIFDIGLDRDFLTQVNSHIHLIGKIEAKDLLQPRKRNSHKGTYGNCLIVGGSYGKMGSIELASKAAMRSGAGLCSVFVPKCGYTILQIAVPEVMVITDQNERMLQSIDFDLQPDVICFGMGAGKNDTTKNAFEALLQKTKKAMLIDADGLNILSENKELLKLIPENSVFTPHPKELERLIGTWQDDFDKIEKVQAFVKKYKIIMVLKGAHTFIFDKDSIYINNSGNPGMGTAGSGDVLSGIITGLMGQKNRSLDAAILGVFLHGHAGDIVAQKKGHHALLSGDIAENLGEAFLSLESLNES